MEDTGRRGDARVKARLKVRFKSMNAFISEYTHNISKGGIFIRTKNLCSLRDKVEVVLILPESEKEINLLGEVIHVVPEDKATAQKPTGMGIQISRINDEDRALIESFINKRLKEEGMEGLDDRREHKRHPSRLKVRFGSKEALVEEYIHNISHGGIFIQTTKPKSLHEELDIILVHPETGGEYKLSGEVIRIVTEDDIKKHPRLRPGMGIRFLEMDEFHKTQIDEFIGAEIRKLGGMIVETEG
jgi:type IV pilus assembly protein PilZ